MNKKRIIPMAAVLLTAVFAVGSADCTAVSAITHDTASIVKVSAQTKQSSKEHISPSGYDLDSAVVLNESYIAPDNADEKAVYLLYSDYNTKVYGTGLYKDETVIIEHNGVIDEFKRQWYGARYEVMTVYVMYDREYDNKTICTSVQTAAGTGCNQNDMVYFYINKSGHYKMRRIEQKTVSNYLNKHVKLKVNKKKHTIQLSSDVSGSSLVYEYDPKEIDGIKSITYTDYPICWYDKEKYASESALEYHSFFEIDDLEMCKMAIPTFYDIDTSVEIIFDGKGGYSFGNLNFKAIS